MNLTTEQIKAILDGAPEGETHINLDDGRYGDYGDFTKCLSDLREILTLRQRVQNLETVAEASMGESGRIKDEASKLGFNPASEDDPLSYLIELAKQGRTKNADIIDAVKKARTQWAREDVAAIKKREAEVAARAVNDAAGIVTSIKVNCTDKKVINVLQRAETKLIVYANQLRGKVDAQEK